MSNPKSKPVGSFASRTAMACLLMVGLAFGLMASSGVSAAKSLITGRDVKDSSLTGKDVRDGSLSAADLSGIVGTPGPTGPRGPAGPTGLTGATGATGATGPVGPKGVSGLVYQRTAAAVTVPANNNRVFNVTCPPGTKVLSGGVSSIDDTFNTRITQSAPLDNGAGWTLLVHNTGTLDVSEFGWAVCAAAS